MQKKTYTLIYFFLFICILLNYIPFCNDTLLLDDPAIVEWAEGSKFLDTLNPHKSFLSGKFEGKTAVINGMYRPLSALSLKVDSIFFGKKYSLWRLENMILHLSNLVILWKILLLLFPNLLPPQRMFLNGLFFLLACHPVFHHAVLWISCRPDLLGANFSLNALFLYWQHKPKPKSGNFWLMIFYFIAGGFCKETYLVAPLILLVIEREVALVPYLSLPIFLRGLVYLDHKYHLPGVMRETYLTFSNSNGFWDVIPGHLLDFIKAPFCLDHFSFLKIRPLWGSSAANSTALLAVSALLLFALIQRKNIWLRRSAVLYLLMLVPFLGSAALGNGFLYHYGSWNAYAMLLPYATAWMTLLLVCSRKSKVKYASHIALLLCLCFSFFSNLSVIRLFQNYYIFTAWQYRQTPENFYLARMFLFTASEQNHLHEGKSFYDEVIANPNLFYLGTLNKKGFEREGLSKIENLGGIIYGKLQQYDHARAIFEQQLTLENRPEIRLDAKWRLYRLASLTKNPAAMSKWKEEFVQDFESCKTEVDVNRFIPLLRDMDVSLK